jgi:hypothetical protein
LKTADITPLQLLEDHLNDLEKAARKSKDAFDLNLIDEETHKLHIKNLTPKIQDFRYAIRVLTSYL